MVRKIGAPQNPEYGIGALAEDGVRVIDERAVRELRLDEAQLEALIARARDELDERRARFRAGHPHLPVAGRTAVLDRRRARDGAQCAGSCALLARARCGDG